MVVITIFIKNIDNPYSLEQGLPHTKRFNNEADYELIRKSIEHLTDERLKEIYDEVMAEKKKNE